MTNICFHYCYRDASNYKNWGEVVFQGVEAADLGALESKVRAALIDNSFFYAERAGIPALYFDTWDETQDLTWHEFSELTHTESSPTIAGSIEALIAILSEMKNKTV